MVGQQRSKIDDALLTARAQAGDGIAFSALVERHYVRVVVVAEVIVGSLATAEICAQEAFARACGRLEDIARPDVFRRMVYEGALSRALVRRPAQGPAGAALRARAVWALREVAGFGYQEIAHTLGLSLAATRRLLLEARLGATDPAAEGPLRRPGRPGARRRA